MNYFVFKSDGMFLIIPAKNKEAAISLASGRWIFIRQLSGFEQAFIETWK